MPDMQVLPPHEVSPVAAATLARRWFPEGAMHVTPMAAVGFSGSPLFRVAAAGATHVLKAFPQGTPTGRVRFVHAAVRHLRSDGLNAVPGVRAAGDGETFIGDENGSWWEMQDFVAGQSIPRPSPPQVAAALSVVAHVHRAAATLAENPPDVGPSPGVARRVDQARGMGERPWSRLPIGREADPLLGGLIRPLVDRASAALAAHGGTRIVATVAGLEPVSLPRQTVLRDLWAPHVLFERPAGVRVAGIVDCHAMGLDSPATDLGRLLGSWAVETGFAAAVDWESALDAYAAVRPLSHAERGLVPFLASSGVVFGLDNWFRWIFEQGRRFSDHGAVVDRIERLVGSLPDALSMLRHTLAVVRV